MTMRFRQFLIVIAVAGLSILATTYVLRSGSSDMTETSAQEKDLKRQIESLRKINESLTADLDRLRMKQDQPAAGQAAAPKPDVTLKAAAPPPALNLTTPGEPSSPDEEPSRVPVIINHPTQAQLDAIKPTPEQSAFFESMKQRLDDPAFVGTMNLSELTGMEEMKTLPDPLRQALLAKAVEKYNRGEVDERTFLSGMTGYQP